MMWTVGLTIPAPIAKSLTMWFAHEPEDRDIEDLMHREGAVSAHVIPPERDA
jgi:hypothetical protein